MEKIGLLATARTKAPHPAPVVDFYKSALFIKSVRYARQHYIRFYFYNAKDGLLLPDRVMAPYDVSIRSFTVRQRKDWGKQVIDALCVREDFRSAILFVHGGRVYRDYLEPELRSRGIRYTVPLEGLGIGRQLRWYDEHTSA